MSTSNIYTEFLHLSLQKKMRYTVSTQQHESVVLFVQSEDFALTSLAADHISLKTISNNADPSSDMAAM